MEIPADSLTVKTPSEKHTIVHRSYLTGADRRAHRRLLIKLSEENKARTVEGMEEAEDAAIKSVIISVDDSNEGIIEALMKMEARDYDFVIDIVEKVTAGIDDKKKAT